MYFISKHIIRVGNSKSELEINESVESSKRCRNIHDYSTLLWQLE